MYYKVAFNAYESCDNTIVVGFNLDACVYCQHLFHQNDNLIDILTIKLYALFVMKYMRFKNKRKQHLRCRGKQN